MFGACNPDPGQWQAASVKMGPPICWDFFADWGGGGVDLVTKTFGRRRKFWKEGSNTSHLQSNLCPP